MKKILLIILFALIIVFFVLYYLLGRQNKNQSYNIVENDTKEAIIEQKNISENDKEEEIEIIAQNLIIPWEIVFLPSNEILVTERIGRVRKIGKKELLLEISGVEHVGEGGLLGMTLHPNFENNKWIYFYYTTRKDGKLKNIIERYAFINDNLFDGQIIIDNIPASSNHNGGRISFGPDGFLYATTGDAGDGKLSQDINSLAGKILRVDDNGNAPSDNPFGNEVYSYGHRNPQGIAWDDQKRLWSTEHGRSGLFSGFDELNLIEKGKNYGWPIVQGDEQEKDYVRPIVHSGSSTTWAPAGMAYFSNTLYFSGLRGSSLYAATIDSQGRIVDLKSYFKSQFGRLRNVKISSDGDLYLLTSNRDGRGSVNQGDDKIIRISNKLKVKK